MLETDALKEKLEMEIHRFARPPEELSSGDPYFEQLQTCNQGTAFAGCGLIRRLTPRECWRLQGFTDEMFDKARAVNSDNQLYRQAGNSVTVPVIYAIGKQILAAQKALECGE